MTIEGTTRAVELRVADVWRGKQAAMPMHLILLEEVGGARLVPIKVGPGEGWAIAELVYREGEVRPLTYTLISTLVGESGAQLQVVTITKLVEQTFYATISLEVRGEIRAVDARPSDAIGLALAAEIPIRADETLLASVGITADPPDILQRARNTGANLVVERRTLTLAPDEAPAGGAPASAGQGSAAPVNLDFAAGLHGWKLAGNLPQEYALTVVPDARQPGKAVASLQAKTVNPDGFGTILQWCRADAYRGTRVRLSAEVKAEGVIGWAGLWMRIDGPGETLRYANAQWGRVYGPTVQLGFDNMFDRPIKGTGDWQRYAVVLDVPEASAAIYYGLLLHGGGQVWLAEMRLETVGVDVPVTGGGGQ